MNQITVKQKIVGERTWKTKTLTVSPEDFELLKGLGVEVIVNRDAVTLFVVKGEDDLFSITRIFDTELLNRWMDFFKIAFSSFRDFTNRPAPESV